MKLVKGIGTVVAGDGEICYSQTDICALANILPGTLSTWIKCGEVPRPTKQVGMRRLYTAKQKDAVLEAIKRKRDS